MHVLSRRYLADHWASAFAWASLEILEQAIEKVGSLDHKKLRDAIASETFQTVVGAVKFEGGFILGGFYALVAVGLGLQYGVARILNVSHGEFIMLGAFGTYSLHMLLGIKPIIALMITAPIIFALAFLIHKVFFMRL